VADAFGGLQGVTLLDAGGSGAVADAPPDDAAKPAKGKPSKNAASSKGAPKKKTAPSEGSTP
jgi:hypothetical protein